MAAKIANDQVGKHDGVLDFFIEKHRNEPAIVVDTVLDLLSRRGLISPDDFSTGLTEKQLLGVFRQYSGGSLDQPAAPAAAPPPSAQPAAAEVPAASSDELLTLPVNVSPSVKKELEKAQLAAEAIRAAQADGADLSDFIAVGTKCKNNTCEQCYAGAQSLKASCLFHPGAPVFHEGLKFWSCCPGKKMTEFSDFLAYPGCQTGTCRFVDNEGEAAQKAKCRFDFFQVGKSISLSIYAKKTVPDKCRFQASSTHLSLSLTYDGGNKEFSMDIELEEPIDPTACKVDVRGPKCELTLVKANGAQWNTLGKVTEHV